MTHLLTHARDQAKSRPAVAIAVLIRVAAPGYSLALAAELTTRAVDVADEVLVGSAIRLVDRFERASMVQFENTIRDYLVCLT